MIYRSTMAMCLVAPIASAVHSGFVLPVLYGVVLIGVSQFVFYGILAANIWLCRRSAVGLKVLMGFILVQVCLTMGLMFFLSPPHFYGMGMFVGPILFVQLILAFAAGYVSCLSV